MTLNKYLEYHKNFNVGFEVYIEIREVEKYQDMKDTEMFVDSIEF